MFNPKTDLSGRFRGKRRRIIVHSVLFSYLMLVYSDTSTLHSTPSAFPRQMLPSQTWMAFQCMNLLTMTWFTPRPIVKQSQNNQYPQAIISPQWHTNRKQDFGLLWQIFQILDAWYIGSGHASSSSFFVFYRDLCPNRAWREVCLDM